MVSIKYDTNNPETLAVMFQYSIIFNDMMNDPTHYKPDKVIEDFLKEINKAIEKDSD